METTYSTKRRKVGMSRSEMAMALGISHKQYKLIDRGTVKMPTKLIDKFNEIVNRGKEIHKLETLDNQREINNFFDEMSTKENDTYRLYAKMQEFNIYTYKQLAQILGYKNGAAISHYLAKPETAPDAFKHMLYAFFQDELNIQEPCVEKINKREPNDERKKLLEWYDGLDFGKFLEENNLSQLKFAEISGVAKSTISKCVTHSNNRPHEKNLILIKKGVDKVMKDKSIKNFAEVAEPMLEDEETIKKENEERKVIIEEKFEEIKRLIEVAESEAEMSLSEKYTAMVKDIDSELNTLSLKMFKLINRKNIYEDLIKELQDRGV